MGRSSLVPCLPQRSPCRLTGAVGATCWRPGFVLSPTPAASCAARSPAVGSAAALPPQRPGHPLAWSRGTRGHRLPPGQLRGEPGEAVLGAVWPGWQRQAHGTLQLCIPVGDKGLALLRINSLSPRPLSRKYHPPVSPCAAKAPPGFVTLLRESIVRTSLCHQRAGRASSAL